MGFLFETITYDLLLIALTLAFYLFLIIRRRLRYFEGTNVPYIPCKSILENNIFGIFSKESLGESNDRMYKKLAGHKYGGFFSLMKPSIIVRDPELIQIVLVKEFQSFNDHGFPTDEESNPLDANLFSLAGPKWRALRRKLSPTFTSGKLKGMFGLIKDCTEELVKYISDRRESDIEIKELLSDFAVDVIGSCAFGLEPTSIKNPNNKFKEMGKEVFHPGISTLIKGIFRLVMPDIFKMLKIPSQSKKISDFFESLTVQTLDHRIKTGEQRNDFVQLLLQLKLKGFVESDPQDLKELEGDESVDQEMYKLEFTDKLLSAQAFVFFIAGFETTANAMSFTMYLLAKNMECQEKVRQEIKEAKEKNSGVITYETCKNMRYLEACIAETLRIYPALHMLPRKCIKDYQMEDGFIIKKETLVIIPVYSLHRDPQYYPDPEKFKPERFLGDHEIKPCTYLPFGYGPRICIARRFSLLEAQLALATVLDKFKLRVSPKTTEPVKLEPQGVQSAPRDGVWLRFEKIKD